ncbi:hypothetical protein TNCV_2991171 [Trichonephila clavipes]|nr:hypothetical protein TNCV_2991171 [Trichonephila clavipes]
MNLVFKYTMQMAEVQICRGKGTKAYVPPALPQFYKLVEGKYYRFEDDFLALHGSLILSLVPDAVKRELLQRVHSILEPMSP